jgi:hypothetical protein
MAKPIIEERFEYKGFQCVVLFMPLGFRNGYVGLPKGNEYYGKDYNDIPVDCHCGLTYADNRLFGQDDENTWWIGFDCGHCCDGVDLDKLHEYYKYNEEVMKTAEFMRGYHELCNEENDFRTLEYVKENCESIVNQLLDWSDSDD